MFSSRLKDMGNICSSNNATWKSTYTLNAIDKETYSNIRVVTLQITMLTNATFIKTLISYNNDMIVHCASFFWKKMTTK